MAVNVAALTLMCLAFSTGFLLVVSFLQKPILPLATSRHLVRENESDVRWIHANMQSFLQFTGPSVMVPVTVFATIARLDEAPGGGLTVVLRGGGRAGALTVAVPREARASVEEELRATLGEFRQNFVWVHGRLTGSSRAPRVVEADWSVAEPACAPR